MTEADPGEVLAVMPDALWPALLQAVRKAADRLGRTQLPAALQPYAGFTPAKLGSGRARATVAAALAADARLREAVGQSLAEPLWQAAAEQDVQRLVAQHGPPAAAAALAARARWTDLQTLSVLVSAAAPAPRPQAPAVGQERPATAKAELAALRRERDAAVRGSTAAQRRATDLSNQVEALRGEVADLTTERDRALGSADEERSRLRDRLARLQRRVSDAESQARADRLRVTRLAGELERLARGLRAEEKTDPRAGDRPAAGGSDSADGSPGLPSLPRGVRTATPGRPSVLPPGVLDSQPLGVEALLAVDGIEVILDGYNVTKDMRGVPTAELVDQRAWLVRIAAAVTAGRKARVTVVFDGDGDRTTSSAAARVVRCMFTAEGETADDRIVALVADLPPDAPVVVITSDREVRERVGDLGANVVASGVFLQAVG